MAKRTLTIEPHDTPEDVASKLGLTVENVRKMAVEDIRQTILDSVPGHQGTFCHNLQSSKFRTFLMGQIGIYSILVLFCGPQVPISNGGGTHAPIW